MTSWLAEIEDDFLRGEFKACLIKCRPVLSGALEPNLAATTKIEVEAHSKLEVSEEVRACAIFLQSLFEKGCDPTHDQDDLALLERFLKQKGPLPFELVVAWINLRSSLGHHEYVKEMLEGFMGRYAERVKRGGVVTPEMASQYATFAYIYSVQTLVHLGEVEGAQRFLAIHNNNVLLSREKRQEILYQLDQEFARMKKDPSSHINNNSNNNNKTLAERDQESQSAPTPLADKQSTSAASPSPASNPDADNAADTKTTKSSPVSNRHPDAAIVLTKDEATYLAVGVICSAVVISQRKKLASALSRAVAFVGNALFSGT